MDILHAFKHMDVKCIWCDTCIVNATVFIIDLWFEGLSK